MPIEVDPSQVHSIEVDPSQVTAAPAPAPAAPSALDSLVDSVKRFAGGLWDEANPIKMGQGISRAAMNPPAAVKGILSAQGNVASEAVDSFKQGNYADGVRHALLYMLPLIGPQIDSISNQGENGDLAGALGRATGAGLTLAVPDSPLVKSLASKALQVVPKVLNANKAEAAAVDFGRANDIPVSAATATGNKFVAGAQKAVEHSPLGSIVAKNAEADQAAAFTRVGGELADQAHPTPVVPTQAGEDVTNAVQKVISDQHLEASKNYSALRQLEADPTNVVDVQTGTKQVETGAVDESGVPLMKTVPVIESMGLPTDLRAAKPALQVVYDQMTRQLPVTQQRASAGLHAIKNILDGPDFAPASQVDMDLGTIKGIARGADLPELKDLSQSLASRAVGELEQAVQTAVSKARRPGTAAAAAGPVPIAPAATAPSAANSLTSGGVDGATNAGTIGQSEGVSGAAAAGSAAASDGPETVVKIPGQPGGLAARYKVQELSSLNASHNGLTFEANPDYPLTNDRDYTNEVNQGKVVTGSSKELFDPAYHITDNPDVTNGPMAVDSDGVVLGGNGRKMILDRVYGANGDLAEAYRALLTKRAARFGIDPAEVAGMKQPVLTRVVDDSELSSAPRAAQNAITDLNKTGTAPLTPAERAIADSRRVSQGTLEDLASRLENHGGDATLADVLQGESGNEVLQKLIDDGVIGDQERPGLQTPKGLNKAGRSRISDLVVGRFFQDPAQLDNLPALLRTRLENIAAPLARVEQYPDWSLTPQVREAMGIIEGAKARSNTLADSLKQGGLFGEAAADPQAVALAQKLQTSKVADLKAAARQYAGEASYASNGGDLFGNNPTPQESFEKSFGAAPEQTAAPEAAATAETPTAAAGAPGAAAAAPPPPAAAAAAAAPKGPYQLPVNVRGVSAGPEAMQLLKNGRAATVAKYDAADVLKSLPNSGAEGRQVFDQAVWAKDAGIQKLRTLARLVPDQIPKIGRAYLEDLFSQATGEGGWGKAKTLLSNWQKLGPETKQVLFPHPQLRQDLDNFFLLAKKSAETPNPSGTATMAASMTQAGLVFTAPHIGVPLVLGSGALAKMLHSPAGVRALTEGLKVPAGAGAARVIAGARILKVASSLGVKAEPLPLAAGNAPSPQTEKSTLLASR